jgi:ribonuclease BN (tRNA processing enzyme)
VSIPSRSLAAVRERLASANNGHGSLRSIAVIGTGADLLIHEGAITQPAMMQSPAVQRIIANHTTPKEAGMVFSKAAPKLAVYTHIVMIPELPLDDLVAETRQTYSGRWRSARTSPLLRLATR